MNLEHVLVVLRVTCLINSTDPKTTTLNFGENLLLTILLPMQKRSGVFQCMGVAGKHQFSLRMYGIVKFAIASQAVVLRQHMRFFPGFLKSSMKVVPWKNFFMLICHENIRIYRVKLFWIMQKPFRKVSLSNFELSVMVSCE
uniref:Transcriptional corepressor SEUSS n=1 Tax=Rhizophora mucronata TaxID=61149 RepID=A0A2P2MJU2_RHIMU